MHWKTPVTESLERLEVDSSENKSSIIRSIYVAWWIENTGMFLFTQSFWDLIACVVCVTLELSFKFLFKAESFFFCLFCFCFFFEFFKKVLCINFRVRNFELYYYLAFIKWFNDNSPLDNGPPDNYPSIIHPWSTTTRIITPHEILPRKIIPRIFTSQTIAPQWFPPGQFPPENCPLWNSPRTIAPGILLLNDYPWVSAPRTITCMKFPCISTIETLRDE